QSVFISEAVRQAFGDVSFAAPPRVIHNGVDTEIFHPATSPRTKAEARMEFGLPASARIVLFVGRFVEKKGLGIMEQLSRLRPDKLFVFVGRGPMTPNT